MYAARGSSTGHLTGVPPRDKACKLFKLLVRGKNLLEMFLLGGFLNELCLYMFCGLDIFVWSGILFYNSTSCNKFIFEFQTHPYGSPLHSYVSSQDLFTSQVQGQRRSSSAGSGSVTPQILLTHSNSARPFPVYTGSQEPRPESQQVKTILFSQPFNRWHH